jgi:hypothetical protein
MESLLEGHRYSAATQNFHAEAVQPQVPGGERAHDLFDLGGVLLSGASESSLR